MDKAGNKPIDLVKDYEKYEKHTKNSFVLDTFATLVILSINLIAKWRHLRWLMADAQDCV